jgi:hypothetical protein
MTSVSDGARKASEVVVRILGGEKSADFKTPALEYGPRNSNWRQLQRWGISERSLPPNSQIFLVAALARGRCAHLRYSCAVRKDAG